MNLGEWHSCSCITNFGCRTGFLHFAFCIHLVVVCIFCIMSLHFCILYFTIHSESYNTLMHWASYILHHIYALMHSIFYNTLWKLQYTYTLSVLHFALCFCVLHFTIHSALCIFLQIYSQIWMFENLWHSASWFIYKINILADGSWKIYWIMVHLFKIKKLVLFEL